MNKKVIFGAAAFVFILIVVLIVVAVSGNKTPKTKTLTYPTGPVTLTFWNLFDDEDVFKETIANYQEQHSNVTIKYVKKDFDTYSQDLLNALAAGNGPDVFTLYHDDVYKNLDKIAAAPEGVNLTTQPKKGQKKDLQTQFKELFVDGAARDLVYQNNIYGVPLWMDSLALYYNQKFFDQVSEEQGQIFIDQSKGVEDEARLAQISAERKRITTLLSSPPQNWNDFVEVAKLITKKDGKGNVTRSAVALGTDSNVNKASDILSLLMMQNNTQMTTADFKTATFNLPIKKQDGSSVYPGTSALDFYTSFALPGRETYTYNKSFPDSIVAFGEEKTAMMFNYAFAGQTLSRQYANLHYQVAPMPQVKGVKDRLDFNYYYPLVVGKNSPNLIVGWDFLTFLSKSQNIQNYLQLTKRPTAIKDRAKETASEAKTPYLESFEGNQVFLAQSYTASNWFKGGEPQKVDEVFKIMIDGVIAKNQALQTAIDVAAASTTNLLQSSQPLIENQSTSP